jgi:hypothetical protein
MLRFASQHRDLSLIPLAFCNVADDLRCADDFAVAVPHR